MKLLALLCGAMSHGKNQNKLRSVYMGQIESGFEKWKKGIQEAIKDKNRNAWNAWDAEIQKAVTEFNEHLSATKDYKKLDWKIIKTMIWVETGAGNSEWNSKPMQIGVSGDPGLKALLSGGEGGSLILPPNLKKVLNTDLARTSGAYNIRAGIGYLLMRAARYEEKSVVSSNTQVYEVTVRSGDSLSKIAKEKGTTVDILQDLNPRAGVLRPGQVLKYKKGARQKVITGWREITWSMIAERYNGGGDLLYQKKLEYVWSLIR